MCVPPPQDIGLSWGEVIEQEFSLCQVGSTLGLSLDSVQ